MSTVAVVFVKEMIDNLRDRRSIAMAMIYPLIGPILLGLMITFVAGSLKVVPGHGVTILAVGAGNAPDFERYLRAHGATLKEAPDDTVDSVRTGAVPFVLVLPR